MKRLICLVCACCLMVTLFINVSLAEACEHNYVDTDQYRTVWFTTDTTHRQVRQRMKTCDMCAATTWNQVGVVVPTAAHSLSVSRNWHNSNGTHSYTLRCSVCGYSRTETRSCDGPPCMNYMGFPIPIIVVDE